MKNIGAERQLSEYNHVYKENTAIYRDLSVRMGMTESTFWILYTLRVEEAPVTQSDMCAILGYPKQTVNSALKKLEQEGLVVMIPRRGAQVASITEKDLNDVLEVRIALENVAIEKACKLITEEELGRLWVAAKEFEKTKAEGNLVRLAETDVAFHEIIYQASDNKRLNQVLNNLREQMYRYRVEYLKEEQTRNLLVNEHEELVKAIRDGNVERAQEISFNHLENQRKAIIRTIRAENEAKEDKKKE